MNLLKIVWGDSMNPKIDERIKEEYEAKIEGKFKIYLGDELYAKGKNKWTRYFVSSLVEFVINPSVSTGYYEHCPSGTGGVYRAYSSGLSRSFTARAGNDTSTPSSPDMSDLVSKIDIAPDTKNVVLFKSAGYSEYSSRHKFVWNAGTIPAQTIGEFGVYLTLTDDSWNSPAENPSFIKVFGCRDTMPLLNPALRLGARIASADGDFDPINYTSEEALILEWYVTIRF